MSKNQPVMSAPKLTEAQRTVLLCVPDDDAYCTTDIAAHARIRRVTGHLEALVRKGCVECVVRSRSWGNTWQRTPAGREALKGAGQ